MADIYTFTFSLEELVLLMRIADLPALASLPGNLFEGVSEERALGALAAAERSLCARGFLQPQGPEKPFCGVFACTGAHRHVQTGARYRHGHRTAPRSTDRRTLLLCFAIYGGRACLSRRRIAPLYRCVIHRRSGRNNEAVPASQWSASAGWSV